MLHINIICVGKIKEVFFKDALDEYTKRLSKYCQLNITEINDEKIPNNASDKENTIVKEKEGKNILNAIKKDSYIICMDLNGKQFSSEEFADKINNISINYNGSVTFIIGGSLGLSDSVISKSNYHLSFSNMTFPHQLARVMLCEQLYRSFQISSGGKYHK